jgi:chromosome segregation ATPase
MSQEKAKAELMSLERKIKLLLSDYSAIKKELQNLRAENQELKSVIKSKDELINHFQNQIKISKIVGSIAVENQTTDSAELKAKINEYIKEIDKCIAHLSE